MGKTGSSCLAEIESETGRLFICASVVAGEALLEDAGQILRCDADAGIADAENAVVHDRDCNGTACRRVFDAVGEYLLDNEEQPFLICQNRDVCGGIDQTKFPSDELRRILADRLANDRVEVIFGKDIIGGAASQAQIA